MAYLCIMYMRSPSVKESKNKSKEKTMRKIRKRKRAAGHRRLVTVLAFLLITVASAAGFSPVYAHRYDEGNAGGVPVKYVTIDMKADGLYPRMMLAGGMLTSAQAAEDMARASNAVAAINGTYFDPYGYHAYPVPYDAMIKDGKLMHIGTRAMIGFKADGTAVTDRVSFEFICYNQNKNQIAAYPWGINHFFADAGAITIFTPEYGKPVDVMHGAKAIVVKGGKVSSVEQASFYVPAGGFAVLFNSAVAFLVDERFPVGETVDWEYRIKTKYTKPEDWSDVVTAVGAGPLLVSGGVVVLNAIEEGFTEPKIISQSTPRSFIGYTKDGKVKMGTFPSATVAQAAQACAEMGLDSAMCLDGGGSVALYYNGVSYAKGRDVNNALVFLNDTEKKKPTVAENGLVRDFKFYVSKNYKGIYYLNGERVQIDGYTINNNTYFKLRDLAMLLREAKPFQVSYDAKTKAIHITTGKAYEPVGGELTLEPHVYNKLASVQKAKLFFNGKQLELEAYALEGYTYFKLRDILKELDVYVGYESTDKSIRIDTAKPYR